jgi:hypothetical protein
MDGSVVQNEFTEIGTGRGLRQNTDLSFVELKKFHENLQSG